MPKTKSRSPRRKRPSAVIVIKSSERIVYQPKYRYRRSRSTSSKRRKRKSVR